MKNKSDNPLNNIFIKDSNGKLTADIDSIQNIKHFFEFLKDDKIKDDSKIKVLDELKKKMHEKRYISEFFSSYENKSIYLFLFELYINKNSSDKLKNSIQSLIEELCINVQTGKNIYEYLFQQIAKIYRGEIQPTAKNLKNYLSLLNSVLCETDNILKPKNYFACLGGNCKFFLDTEKMNSIDVGYSFTININFKITVFQEEKNPNKNRISNLIKITFSNKKQLSIDLQYPCSLIVKEIRKEPIKIL
jgi:Txe/YoeB family toxin of Txe-Axe toxin-antitoxin module